MNIAILTLPLHANYGGIIQNYALQTVLRRMGHSVDTINLRSTPLGKKYDIPLLKMFSGLGGRSRAKQNVRRFMDEHISFTTPLRTKKELCRYDFSAYDAVIVGSDQVWRACYAYPDIYAYYLDFIRDGRIRKIAYSASFGTDTQEYTPEQAMRCGECIRDFDVITVREQSALTLINDVYQWHCKSAPVQTLDPTMLLHSEDYVQLASGYGNDDGNRGGLFYYVLDMTEEKRDLINRTAAALGVKPFTVNRKSRRWYDSLEKRMVPPVEEWLMAFDKARYVFTDSFHGSVFSIIFNKDFVAFGNKKRGMGRFRSLMDKFQLGGRLVYMAQEFSPELFCRGIDWDAVNSIREAERELSLACLERGLQAPNSEMTSPKALRK